MAICQSCGTKNPGYTFHSTLEQEVTYIKDKQTTRIYRIDIECSQCEEVVASTYVCGHFNLNEPSDNWVFGQGEKFLTEYLRNTELTDREENAFENCPCCRTSLYVSMERPILCTEAANDRMYRVVCHKCNRSTYAYLDTSAAIDEWNKMALAQRKDKK